MLAWRAVAEVKRDARLEHLQAFLDAIGLVCEQAGVSKQIEQDLRLVVEEACVNVIHHAYPPGAPGPLAMTVYRQCEPLPPAIVIRLRDRGRPFNPVQAALPDLDEQAETRPIGGLGTMLIREMSDEQQYEREESGKSDGNDQRGINCLTLVKFLHGPPGS